MKKQQLAIFASGNGSNAMKIIAFFKNHYKIEASLLVCNNKNAGILEKSKGLIKQEVIDNKQASNGEFLIKLLKTKNIDYIALAGYLRMIPPTLIEEFPEQIINIHPALLPNYGGKGMYGMNVHRAIHQAKEDESGITIHTIDQEYDKGKIIQQFKTPLAQEDSPEVIQKKVLQLEHRYFAPTIEEYIQNRNDK